PPHRRTPVIRLAIVALVLLLGSRALGVLQPQRDLHPIAATAPTATLHPAVASRPATRARPAPTATPSPSRPAPAPQLPQVTVPDAATQVEPNHMGISTGEKLTVRELIDGMMLDSGNDAAEALAMGIVDRAAFITFMNQKAAALHLRATHFTNPSGLDETDHY